VPLHPQNAAMLIANAKSKVLHREFHEMVVSNQPGAMEWSAITMEQWSGQHGVICELFGKMQCQSLAQSG